MTSERKFFKTVYTVTVLSEDTPFEGDLHELAEVVESGDCCGGYVTTSVEITGKQAADGLCELASDPGFFQLDSEGNDLDDEEEREDEDE